MGYTEGTWRLKALMIIVIVMSCMYSAQAMLMNMELRTVEGEGFNYSAYDPNASALSQEMVSDVGGDIFATLGFIFSIATFTAPEGIPLAGVFILTFFAVALWMTLGYIVYTFLYEILKGLPFT